MCMFNLPWQDVVFMVGNLIFLIALLPSIFSDDKPAKWTSLSTAIVLSLYVVTYYSLSLTYASITGTLSALAWWVLYFQKR